MTTTPKLTFAEYLTLTDPGSEGRVELIEGVLSELPPESGFNSSLVMVWVAELLRLGESFACIKPYCCEVETPVLSRGDAANRYPDLVLLKTEHVQLTRHRNTITLTMPPPRWVLEVVSPGQENRDRDYVRKRDQYAAVGIPEYVIVDPQTETVTVLILRGDRYQESGCYQGDTPIVSPTFPALVLTATQLFAV